LKNFDKRLAAVPRTNG